MGSWRSRGRRPAREPKVRPDHHAVAAARGVRRTALIREALLTAGGSPLTHEWLAERTGVPLGYLQWRFPALDDLLRELGPGRSPASG
jgi:hypothetical protein